MTRTYSAPLSKPPRSAASPGVIATPQTPTRPALHIQSLRLSYPEISPERAEGVTRRALERLSEKWASRTDAIGTMASNNGAIAKLALCLELDERQLRDGSDAELEALIAGALDAALNPGPSRFGE